ncbi:MAG: heavy-metal-associated domain-containing protein [Clostridia bacterium]|nr:heavy-metal-associated domain-containing protein [Clostridia bacterium]
MENIILKINGMKCTGCSQRVERALKNTDGIESASVNLETREANISYNKGLVTYDKICETIVDLGFEVEK